MKSLTVDSSNHSISCALIEMNDAFSLGLYQNSLGTPKDELEKHYAKCLISRWKELVNSKENKWS